MNEFLSRVNKIKEHVVYRNAIALFSSRITSAFLNLASIPYLSRILDTQMFGLYMFSLAFAFWLGLIIEYGFNLSATRDIAKTIKSASHKELGKIVVSVQSAKFFLIILCMLFSIVFIQMVPIFNNNPSFAIISLLLAIMIGINPMWYFLGIEKVKYPAIVEIFGNIIFLGLLFLFVKNESDALFALLLQLFTKVSVNLFCTLRMYKEVKYFKLLRISDAMAALKSGLGMFLFRASVSFYTTANVIILGFFVSPAVVGFYASAEKIAKAGFLVFNPLSEALFPRMSDLVQTSPAKAMSWARKIFIFYLMLGLIMSIICFFLADIIIRMMLGEGYDEAVEVFKILIFLLPIIACSNVLGLQLLVPLGEDKRFNAIIITAGILNLIFGIVFSYLYGALGMACSVILAELYVVIFMLITLRKLGFDIFSSRIKVVDSGKGV